jgi:competence protein ComEC
MNKQISFSHVPFFRILVPFICGICACYYFDIKFLSSSVLTSMMLFLVAWSIILPLIFRLSKLVEGFAIAFSFFLIGVFLMRFTSIHTIFPTGRFEFSGIVFSVPQAKEKATQLECKIFNYQNKITNSNVSEKIILYYQDDPLLSFPSIGDSVFFNANIQAIANNSNPGEFNFAQYMKDKGIIYSSFVQKGKIRFGGDCRQYAIRRLASHVQLYIEKRLHDFSLKGQELAVISALFAGDRSLLDYETTKSYISSGAVHILSVSGLHVGILFMFLSVIFGKRNSSIPYTILRLFIILALIWFYAFITGLSPSVIRASVMFSLFLIGKSFNRQLNSYNILAGSALLILVVDPAVLFQIGFQLSYIAVLGIVLFQEKISGIFDFDNVVIDRIWQLTAVGIAAQLATFPLSLYYFHQFPVFFWLTNILVIPLTWLIMMCTILFFMVLPLSGLAGLVAYVLNLMLILMNFIVLEISQFPFATIANVRFGTFNLVVICLAIIGTAIIYSYGKQKTIPIFLGFLVVLIFSSFIIKYTQDEKKKEIIIYNTQKGISLSIVNGHKHLFLGNTKTIHNFKYVSSRLNNFWVGRSIKNEMLVVNIDTIVVGNHFLTGSTELFKGIGGLYIVLGNKELFIPDKNYKTKYSINFKPGPSKKYFLLVTDSIYSQKIDLMKNRFSKIIIAEDIRATQKEKWKNISSGLDIDLYDVTGEGSIRLNTEIE